MAKEEFTIAKSDRLGTIIRFLTNPAVGCTLASDDDTQLVFEKDNFRQVVSKSFVEEMLSTEDVAHYLDFLVQNVISHSLQAYPPPNLYKLSDAELQNMGMSLQQIVEFRSGAEEIVSLVIDNETQIISTVSLDPNAPQYDPSSHYLKQMTMFDLEELGLREGMRFQNKAGV